MERAWNAPVPLDVRRAPRRVKVALSWLLARSRLLALDEATRPTDVVYAIGYHGTPRGSLDGLRGQFEYFRDRFDCLGEDELLAFLRDPRPRARPGVVLSFDDGVRDHAELAAPLLERHGLRGWFMVPGSFLAGNERDCSTACMTWSMARDLAARGHVIGCHSWSHRALCGGVSSQVVDDEVTGASRRFAQHLGRAVRTFAWVRGRVEDYSAEAHRAVASTFEIAFTSMARAIHRGDDPHALHRFHIEASFPIDLVRFQMSRFNELAFARRRRAVESVFATAVREADFVAL